MAGYLRILILLLLMCLVPPTLAVVPRFAYVVNAYDSTLSVYRVAADSGHLQPLGHIPLQQFPSSVVTHPSGRFVFVSAQTGMTVQVFAVDQRSGALSEIEGSPFDPQVVSPFWLVTDPAGRFLFIAGRNSNAISVMKIDPASGALSLVRGAPYSAGYLPRAVAMHPGGDFVYMTNINDDSISAWSIDKKSGALTPVSDRAFPGGDAPQFMVVHPDGERAWLNSWNTRSVIGYRVDRHSGALQVDYEQALPEGLHPFGLAMTSDGRYLYVASWFGGIMAYRINEQDGRLSPLPGAPFATFGNQPVQIFVAPGDRFAYVTNYESNTLTVYRIDPQSGVLTAKQTVTSRIGPRAMAFVSGEREVVAAGARLLSLDREAARLREFAVDAGSGELAAAGGLDLPAGVEHIAVSDDGRYLLATGHAEKRLWSWRRGSDGSWQAAPGSPLAAQGGPVAAAIDYNNKYAYAINQDGRNMSAYMLMSASGALDEAPQTPLFSASPYATTAPPLDLALHPTDRFAYVLGGEPGQPARLNMFKYYEFGPLVIDVDKTGIPEGPELGCSCTQLELDYSGRFMYLAAPDGEVRAWYLDTLSGQPRVMGNGRQKLAAGSLRLVADPVRSRLYVLNPERQELVELELDVDAGRLHRRQVHKLPATPLDLVLNPSGTRAWLSLANQKLIIFAVSDEKLTREKVIKTPGALTDMFISRLLQ